LLEAIETEVRRWTQEPFALTEIEKVRRMTLVGTISSFQTAHGQASSFASGEFYSGSPAYFQTYLRRMESITPDSLLAVARKYLRAENRTTAVLAPNPTNREPAAVAATPAAGQVEKIALANGLTLLVREDHQLPMVWMCAVGGGGLLLETETNNGITSLMAELLTRGAGRRTAEEIAQTVESLGASLSAYSGRNSFGMRVQCLAADAPVLMELLGDCLLAPAFAPEELAKRKPIQLAAIRQQRESPMFIAQEALAQALFPGHPYRFFPEGNPQAVEATTAAQLREWHARLAVNSNLVLAVFGDIAPERARALAEQYFKILPAGPRVKPTCANPRPELPQRVNKREPREQAIFLAGFPGVDLLDPRNDALSVLHQAMSGLTSDLMISIRDKRGLAYYTGAMNQAGVVPGMFGIYAGTRAAALEQVEALVREEIARVTTQGIRPEELERARQKMLTEHAQHLQVNGELAFECALDELYGRGYAYNFATEARLQKITPEAVREAAAAILNTNRMVISVVEPNKEKGGR
jgi:zinc protease